MLYLSLKYVHLISMVLLFGTGLGSAWYKWMADRSGSTGHMAVTNRHVVLADWLFTTPTIIIQPLSGLGLLWVMDIPFVTPWVIASLALYVLAGACWFPVVWLQIQMSDLATMAMKQQTPLPDRYWQYARWWFWLGVPAFFAMLCIVLLMVFKSV